MFCRREEAMRAMALEQIGRPLRMLELPIRAPAVGEVLIRVRACGVCRTDVHICDGDLPMMKTPLVLGHEVVGDIAALGPLVNGFAVGERVGVPWLGWTCRACHYCRAHRENLCDEARFTGYQIDGGYAETITADARHCFPLPAGYGDAEVAPLLCAGLIGYRSFVAAGDVRSIGIYGFGAAGHIVCQLAVSKGIDVYAFTKPGDTVAQDFAVALGAIWAGDSTKRPREFLDAAILFAPVGDLVPIALRAIHKGGTVVCAGIHMSAIPAFPYEILWGERRIVSVANLTRQDGEAFLSIAPRIPVRTKVDTFPLAKANEALARLRNGQLTGAAVLTI
jgi:alcohol dehydrogenase, propanol-preferring